MSEEARKNEVMIKISAIRKFNENYEKMIHVTDDFTEAEKLRARLLIMLNGSKTKEEIVKLHEDICLFFKANPSEADKKMVLQYSESLAILYDAVKRELLK